MIIDKLNLIETPTFLGTAKVWKKIKNENKIIKTGSEKI